MKRFSCSEVKGQGYNETTCMASRHNHKMNLYSAAYNTGQWCWTE